MCNWYCRPEGLFGRTRISELGMTWGGYVGADAASAAVTASKEEHNNARNGGILMEVPAAYGKTPRWPL
jgi:hypothetical protein